jgi:hypothetical protein
VTSFQGIGFGISTESKNKDNPIYKIKWSEQMRPYEAFLKRYEDDPNPKENFALIKDCSKGEECPIVFGCDYRLSLPYDDPKDFDDTTLEESKYDKRVRQIDREMLYVCSNLN